MTTTGKVDLRVVFGGQWEDSSVLKRKEKKMQGRKHIAEQSWSHCGLIDHYQQLEHSCHWMWWGDSTSSTQEMEEGEKGESLSLEPM